MSYLTIHQYYLYPTADYRYFTRKLRKIEIERLAKRHEIEPDEIFYEKIKVKVLEKANLPVL